MLHTKSSWEWKRIIEEKIPSMADTFFYPWSIGEGEVSGIEESKISFSFSVMNWLNKGFSWNKVMKELLYKVSLVR